MKFALRIAFGAASVVHLRNRLNSHQPPHRQIAYAYNRYDYEVTPWESDWDGLDEAEVLGQKHFIFITPFSCNKDRAAGQVSKVMQRLANLGVKPKKILCAPEDWELANLMNSRVPSAPFDISREVFLSRSLHAAPDPAQDHIMVTSDRDQMDAKLMELEDAFEMHFKRNTEEEEDEYEVVMASPSVIGYFVCKLMQLPPNAWGRFRMREASLTWLTARKNGEVELHYMDDTGHLNRDHVNYALV